MASTTAYAGKRRTSSEAAALPRIRSTESIGRLSDWLEKNDYRGYDTFDGLNAKFLRPLTLNNKFLAHGAPARSAPVSDQPAPPSGSSQEPFHQGHGLSGQRIYASSRSHR